MRTRHDANPTLTGTLLGVLATVPMTLIMRGLHRQFSSWRREPLPPQRITARVARAVGLPNSAPPVRSTHWDAKTYLSHFAYGGSCGALYAKLSPRFVQPSATSGMAFAILIWIGSYLGWLPLVGLHRPLTREPAHRNVTMFIAHLMFGLTLGILRRRQSMRRAATAA